MKLLNNTDLVNTFEKHWETNLTNISSPALRKNWKNNFDAFDEVINRNSNNEPSKKICCPSPTGSGKTQQAIHKAISLYGTQTMSLIVTMRTEDADLIANQIRLATGDEYVAVNHSNSITIEGVVKASEVNQVQCLVVTHEMFRRQESTVTEFRDLIIIDEAIDVITHYQIDEDDLNQMLQIIEAKRNLKYKDKDESLLESEERILQMIKDIQFATMKKTSKSFIPIRPNAVPEEDALLETIELTELKKLLNDPSVKPSVILTKMHNDIIDTAIKKKLLDICDHLKYFFSQFTYLTKNGNKVAWSTANELIPDKSVVIMDATASVNKAYEFYMKYQPDKLKVLPSIACRDYSNVKLHTARTHTGRSTILASEMSASNKGKQKSARTIIGAVQEGTNAGDDILIVTFKELEPSLITYIESVTDRRIRVDHWGNLTGTNKYNSCNKIFIYGLNHKPKEIHRSLHALIKSPVESFKDTDQNNEEFHSLINSDIVAEVIQAINRIACRNVIDDKGSCIPVDVYLTLPSSYHTAQEMQMAIQSEMHNIQILEWTYHKHNTKTLTRTSFLEGFMAQLDVLLTDKRLEVKLPDVLDALQLSRKQWRDHIKGNKLFQATIDASPFMMEMRHSVSRRGVRSKTANTPWFFRK